MRGPGWSASTPNRAASVGPTWLPRPRTNRPPLHRLRSQAAVAVAAGERAKATATLVPTSTRSVAWTAAAARRYGSRRTSRTQTASQPAASAAAARRAASRGLTPPGRVRPTLPRPDIAAQYQHQTPPPKPPAHGGPVQTTKELRRG